MKTSFRYRRVPDDWDSYYVICEECGHRYHASEWCENCKLREEENEDSEQPEDC